MSRFLVATMPITGHVATLRVVAQALREAGHEVRWYCGQKFRQLIEATGAHFLPRVKAHDFDDADLNEAFPKRQTLSGLDLIRFDLIQLFMNNIVDEYHDLQTALDAYPADIVLGDSSMFALQALHARGGPIWATQNISCLGIRSPDVPPLGLGLMPKQSRLGRLRNRLLYTLAQKLVFREVLKHLDAAGKRLEVHFNASHGMSISPYLFLQPTIPAFEYPRNDLPTQVHFIGALLPKVSVDFSPPPFLREVTAKKRPVILVTQGTIATNPEELIKPALHALAHEDLLVVVTTGTRTNATLNLYPFPQNARVTSFIPYSELMPFVDIMVTNGGYGGVHYALSHGVPLIAAGNSEDKPEVCNRIAYAGVGINLKTSHPSPRQIRQAVNAVLSNPCYRQRAQTIQAELLKYNAPAKAVRLLETLLETKAPVLRS